MAVYVQNGDMEDMCVYCRENCKWYLSLSSAALEASSNFSVAL